MTERHPTSVVDQTAVDRMLLYARVFSLSFPGTAGSYIDKKELPDEISSEFIKIIQEALAGLSKIEVKTDQLKAALFPDGSPATTAEFKDRFDQFVKDLLKGKDAGKVRIVID